MLENEYSQTKTLFTFVKVYFWFILAVYFVASLAFGLFKDDKGGRLQTFGILTVISIAAYVYLLMKYGLRRKSLQLYLMNLASGDAVQALESGRRFYSIRRKGLSGADGSGLTIYDEQAIQNDILSYIHGGTRTINYDTTENPFTPTKMLMATGCAVAFIGIAYFISPKSHAESLPTEVTTTSNDYAIEQGPQQVQHTETVLPNTNQENEVKLDKTVQEQPATTPDSLQHNAEAEAEPITNEANTNSIPQNLDILGTWVGTLGEKPFVLHIDKAGEGGLTGWNKTGNNKRPVTGTVKELSELNSNVKYELKINEPGSDKWDGVFTLTLTSPMANAAPTVLMGEWSSFNGKLTKQVEAKKTVE